MRLSRAACIAALLLSSCATDDHPPCRRVTAQEFMRPHTFKGIASDQFIGTSGGRIFGKAKAFKTVWEMGFNHSWAVLWVPADELPPDYLKEARRRPILAERPDR